MNYRKIYEAGQNERLIEGLGDFFSSGAKELVRNITNSESKEYDGRVSELGELVYSKMFAVNDNNVFDALMKLNKNTDFSSASATEIEYKIENDRVICYVPLHLAGTSRKQKFYISAPLSSLVVQYLKGIGQLKLLQKISHSFDCLDYDEVGDATKKDFITDIASQVEVLKKHELNKRLNNKASKDTRKQSKEDNHKSLLKQFESKIYEAGYSTFKNHLGELDSFYDPYKSEPEEATPLTQELIDNAGADKVSGSKKSPEEVEEEFARWESVYYTDRVHDLKHDGDWAGAAEEQRRQNTMLAQARSDAKELGLSSDEIPDSCERVKDFLKRIEKSEKRKATFKQNRENQKVYDKEHFDELCKEMLDALKEYSYKEDPEYGEDYYNRNFGQYGDFNEDGSLKTRGSYKRAKEYATNGFSPELKKLGKVMMRVWVAQFGN